ncbi:Solute carrier family 25 member 35 [Orchesella cincta]|uniref:Solute carrier family 25 member 35 n=1 Tax=Orchesella cincta TaxID=48709 RepID=A0A1D2MXA5_ORCCI|nr:Solute carrier family 25 member 35 [Orchesella cincta]
MELVLGGVAAVGAGFFSNPLEVVKIRMQLQGELQAKGNYSVHYKNVFHAAYTIGAKDGLVALQKGLVPALWYQWVMNGTRLGLYHLGSEMGLTRNKDGHTNVLRSALVASAAGIVAGVVGSPLFLVKTQLQSRANDTSIAVGQQHKHTRMMPAFGEIYRKFGVLGFWRGTTGSLPRLVVASAVQIPTFEKTLEFVKSKHIFKEGSFMNPFCASMIAGLFVSFAMAPFDLMSTRFYNQGVDANGKGLLYKNLMDCGVKIYKKEGPRGFFKGWTANYFRLGPHTLLSLVFWEQLRYSYHEYELEHPKLARFSLHG